MNKLYVNEVFQSPQGEGFFTGRLAIFVRFAGCNLCCDFCDTKYAWNREDGLSGTPQHLMGKMKCDREGNQWKSKFVVLTGGEPMIQDQEALREFVCLLKDAGYFVAMETNGTKMVDKYVLPIDWLTVSPKTALFIAEGDELKLLYTGTEDLEFYEQFDYKYFYLQPVLPEKGLFINDLDTKIMLPLFEEAFKKVKKAVEERPIWRISFQAQKLAGYR